MSDIERRLTTFLSGSHGHNDPHDFQDQDVLALGLLLQWQVPHADSPITGNLKQRLNALMLSNIASFQTAFENGPLQLAPSHPLQSPYRTILTLFSNTISAEATTYRTVIDLHCQLVDGAERILFQDKGDPYDDLGFSFKPIKTHFERVDAICKTFPAICQLPLQRPNGVFSYHLLARQLDTFQVIHDRPHVVWPYAIDIHCKTIHGMKATPSGLGRHDRIHLGVFLNTVTCSKSDPTDPIFKDYPDLFIALEENVKRCLKTITALRNDTWAQKMPIEKQLFDFIQYFTLHENLICFQEFPDEDERIQRLVPMILNQLKKRFHSQSPEAWRSEVEKLLSVIF